MRQTISREEQKVQVQQSARTDPSGGHFSAARLSQESHFHRGAQAPTGFLAVIYERFLHLPTAVVLMVLWLVGMAMLSGCVLVLYELETLLA